MSRRFMLHLNEGDIEALMEGYSRKEWAEVLGVTVSAINKWVQRHRIPVDVLQVLTEMRRVVSLQGEAQELSLKQVKESLRDRPYDSEMTTASEAIAESRDTAVADPMLEGIPTESLVTELESRGWVVTLNKR